MPTLSLARATLRHEWKRFLAAGLAVTFSGLLLLVQVGLLLGLFETVSVMVDKSRADLWVGFRNLESVDMGRPIPAASEALVRRHPQIAALEPLVFAQGEWRKPDGTKVFAFLQGISLAQDAMAFAHMLSPGLREALREPGSVVLDEADVTKMGAKIGGTVELNAQRVKVVGTVMGLRGMGSVNLLSSQATARRLAGLPSTSATYYLARLTPGSLPENVCRDLEADGRRRGFQAYPAAAFSTNSQLYWLLESGAGLGTLFSVLLGLMVGVAITSQVLMGTVLSYAREYATLRALGVSMPALRKVVLEQAAWIGTVGMGATWLLVCLLRPLAQHLHVAMVLPWWSFALTGGLVVGIALGSGLLALRSLRQTEPATLLR